jgi:hypothetical protein
MYDVTPRDSGLNLTYKNEVTIVIIILFILMA